MDISEIITRSFNDVLSAPSVLLPSLIVFVLIFAAAAATILLAMAFSGIGILSAISSFSHLRASSAAMGAPTVVHTFLQAMLGVAYSIAVLCIILAVVSFIAYVLLNGIIIAMGDQLYRKARLDIGRAFRLATSKYLSLLGAGIAVSLLILLVIGAAVLGIVSAFSAMGAIGGMFSAMLIVITLIVVLLFASIFFFQVSAAIILENKSAIGGLRRSIEIASRNKLNIFALLILMSVIAGAIEFVGALLALVPVLGWIIAALMGIFVSVWLGVIPAYFYRNLGEGSQSRTGTGKQAAAKSTGNA